MKDKWTTVRVDRETLAEISKISKSEQRTVPTIIRRLVSFYNKMKGGLHV